MAIKDILVHVVDGDAGAARVRAAAALARTHQAHLTGLYAMWIPPIPGYIEAQIGAEVMQTQRSLYLEQARLAEETFNECAEDAGVPTQWRCVETDRPDALALHARYCDLVVTGRREESDDRNGVSDAEHVVLTSAKPVLVMPDTRGAPAPGEHMMVAWDGSRESTRAVDAALPLLTVAKRVSVVCIDPRDNDHGDIPGADLCAHLARHGIRTEAQSVDSGGQGAGPTLLGRAGADGADCLVMGAYGHSRLREVVLGGATAHVLQHARIPLLMAH
jgi:nucleotide-binding universal stress UspA family protein